MMAKSTADALIDHLWAYWQRMLASDGEPENEMLREGAIGHGIIAEIETPERPRAGGSGVEMKGGVS